MQNKPHDGVIGSAMSRVGKPLRTLLHRLTLPITPVHAPYYTPLRSLLKQLVLYRAGIQTIIILIFFFF